VTGDDWHWDETPFAGAALYYVRGRLPYAAGLADAIRDALALDGRGKVDRCRLRPQSPTRYGHFSA
jgi:hypothetical protein